MASDAEIKKAVSITEMARMVGLSRARFYQLVRQGKFPSPDKEEGTSRPFFSEDKQRQCLEVRRRNCGIDGKSIMFYARRRDIGITRQKDERKKPASNENFELIDGLKALGLNATQSQVVQALKELFPDGVERTSQSEILKVVFLHIRRQNSGSNDRG